MRIITIILLFFLLTNVTVAEDKFKTLDSEITRLSKQYSVNEKTVRAIIQCESEMYGSAVNENKRNGLTWSRDIGVWQINDYYHKATMASMGLDIYNQFDNLEYGFFLISKSGFNPWAASRNCWLQKI